MIFRPNSQKTFINQNHDHMPLMFQDFSEARGIPKHSELYNKVPDFISCRPPSWLFSIWGPYS